MLDVFLPKDVTELNVVLQAYVPIAGAQDNFNVPEIAVVGTGHEIYWIVEVDVVVIIAVHERLDVESTAQAEEMANHLGMTEGEVTGAESAKTDATTGHFAGRRVVLDLRDKLLGEELVILNMTFYPVLGVGVTVPAAVVDAIGAENLHKTPLYEPANGFNHPPIFGFFITSKRGGENDKRVAMGANS